MHVFFSGIGGAAIGPLALIAKQAGYDVSGSDAADSGYITYLRDRGITQISIGQTTENIAQVHSRKPIDWFVYSSALPKTNPNHPELIFCQKNNIKATKRDEFLGQFLKEKNLKMLAAAGTHGKTTTTAMLVWLFKLLDMPVSYSVGAKLSFGEMGQCQDDSRYFIYEADEYDRNFLSFNPEIAAITGLDWDHPDIYPTKESYLEAFNNFIDQSSHTIIWRQDAEKLGLSVSKNLQILDDREPLLDQITLAGLVNRQDGALAVRSVETLGKPQTELIEIINKFPGLSRRFEQIVPKLYTDYAHTPPKIRGALQLAHEVAGENVVVVYEGLHNTRQHFIKDELASLFDSVKKLYIVPSFLARENKDLELLTPEKMLDLLSISAKPKAHTARLDEQLKDNIQKEIDAGNLVLCFSAGSSGSLDEWLRQQFV